MKPLSASILVTLVAVILTAAKTQAQYPFGKNKVVYAPKSWRIIETKYVDIYFYPDELPIARFVESIADSTYEEIASFMRFSLDSRIPVILYGTHHDFSETNVTPYIVSESTAGFTEFGKGRIVLPFDGSYPRLVHVLRHEMVHAVMLEKLRAVTMAKRRWRYEEPPLWFVEGLAEYIASREPDAEAHMFLRDAATADLLYPLDELWRIEGSYLLYKLGESAVRYVATRYGDEALVRMLENWWRFDRFETLLVSTLGISQRQLSEDWMAYLKRRYYPSLLHRRSIVDLGEPISDGKMLFEMHPVAREGTEGEDRIFFVGYHRGSMNLVEYSRDRKGEIRKSVIVRGGLSGSFESIPSMRSRPSLRGDTLVFTAKAGERDAIYIYDIEKRKVLCKFSLPDARILSSPSLSPDGRKVVFSAIGEKGKSDIFVYDLVSNEQLRITDDYYDDVFPDWHPFLPLIAWSSNRCSDRYSDAYAIYQASAEGKEVRQLTEGRFRDLHPRWLPDGTGLIFSSDRDGTADIYSIVDNRISRRTNSIGGAFSPFPCDDGSFLCTSYEGGRFRTYRVRTQYEAPAMLATFEKCDSSVWNPTTSSARGKGKERRYRSKLELDLIGATFSPDPDFGQIGNGVQIFFTDILGNRQIATLVGAATDDFSNMLEEMNFALTYSDLSRRPNWAAGVFRLAGFSENSTELVRYERRAGAMAAAVYPFNSFVRMALSTVLRNMEREDDWTSLGLKRGSSWLVSQYLSVTFDNIVWYIGGPLEGSRLNVSFGNTLDLEGESYENRTLNVDVRHYIPFSDRVVLAQRVITRKSWGSDIQLFYLGGSWDLRGYRFRQFVGTSTFLFNTELRFPLVDRFIVKFPVGAIEFPLFRGSLFIDAGRASGFIYDSGWIGSLGTSVELCLGYLPVARVNFSRRTDFESIESDWHVDLFLGYNF